MLDINSGEWRSADEKKVFGKEFGRTAQID
jgi:hypothetical protein